MSANLEIIRQYITPDPRIILCVRSIDDVIESFTKLFARNGRTDFDDSPFANELALSIEGLRDVSNHYDPATFLFVEYEDLVSNPDGQLDRIYEFFELDRFDHDLENIVNLNPENDEVYGLVGMHEIRSKVSRRIEIS